jgi:hypothetical protein
VRRRIFNLLAAVSLILFVATVVLWMRSYFVMIDALAWWNRGPASASVHHAFETGIGLGGAAFCWNAQGPRVTKRPLGWVFHGSSEDKPYYPDPAQSGHWFGFQFYLHRRVDSNGMEIRQRFVVVPCWSIALAFAILPAQWIKRWAQHRKLQIWQKQGRCLRCGYDLRASTDRCPECGTAISPRALSEEHLA